jgi:hypothetical protein
MPAIHTPLRAAPARLGAAAGDRLGAEFQRETVVGAPFEQAAVVYGDPGVAVPDQRVCEAGRSRAGASIGDDLFGVKR